MREGIPTDKNERYTEFLRRAKYLLGTERNEIANMANFCALTLEYFDFFWVGFYIKDSDKELVLGPFQGPTACTRIPFGKGVCGASWRDKKTIIVPDVDKFPGHIACSIQSRSEIVVPVFRDGEVVAVLDIDSDRLNAFDETDGKYLEELVKFIY